MSRFKQQQWHQFSCQKRGCWLCPSSPSWRLGSFSPCWLCVLNDVDSESADCSANLDSRRVDTILCSRSVFLERSCSVYLQSHGADNNLLAQSWGEYYFVPGLACLLLWQLSFGLDSAPIQHWAVSVDVRLALTALTWSWCRLHRSAEVVAVVGGGEGRLVASLGRLWAILP